MSFKSFFSSVESVLITAFVDTQLGDFHKQCALGWGVSTISKDFEND